MRKMRLISASLMLLMMSNFAQATNAWVWGENEVEAKGNWMKMEGLVKQKKYQEATPMVSWLLKNTPELNVALYINAIKVYENRVNKERNPEKKVMLQDSTLGLYDKRIALFGSEGKVLNRKGRVAFKYLSKRENTADDLFTLYDKIYTLNKGKTKAVNLYNLMQSACLKFNHNSLTKEELFSVFEKCNQTFDQQILTSKKVKRVEKYKSLTILNFASNAKLDCGLIQSEFGKNFTQEKSLSKANVIISLCVAQKCFADSSFVDAAQYLSENGKANYSLEVTLARAYAKRDDIDSSLSSFDRAVVLTEDSVKKAELFLEKAKLEGKRGNLIASRDLAREALKLNSSLQKAYAHIGDLYVQGANQCSSGNKVENRSVYIAAANKYQKAGLTGKVKEMKLQFPSVEELFLYNLKAGDSFNTKCWVNENVKLQTR